MVATSTPFQSFSHSAARRPSTAFAMAPAAAGLPWAPAGFSLTYAEANARVMALREQYGAAGYGHGSRVALLLENRPEFLLHWLALNSIGASIVPVSAELRPDELAHQMHESAAEAMVFTEGFEHLVAAGVPAGVATAPVGTAIPPARRNGKPRDGTAEDEAALLFTSGSTGKPKACILSNLYFMILADWYLTLPGVALGQDDVPVALTPLPFHHMNALGCTAAGMMRTGGTIVPLDRFHPKRWWQTIAESGATLVHGLGVIPAILLQLPESPAERRHRAHALFSPGVEAAHKAAFEQRFGLPVLDGWAMTESGGAAVIDTVGLAGPLEPRSIGHLRTDAEWRIAGEDGRDVPEGEAGELLLRSRGPDKRRGFFSGYAGAPDATEEAWRDGWFHTGDIVRVDSDCLFTFVDRKKNIVRRSGENISALEVEAALLDDPAVHAVAVTPVPDALRGEEVFAFVIPAPDRAGDNFAASLVERLASRLSYQKLPGFVALVDSLPLGSTQKGLRGQLRSDAERALANGKAVDVRKLKSASRKAPA